MSYVFVFLFNVVGLVFGLDCAFNSMSDIQACSLNIGGITCNLPTNGRKQKTNVVFKLKNETFYATPSTYSLCASIDYFWRGGNGYTENVYFYPDTATGRLTVDRQCWDRRRGPTCILSFKVPQEIASLSIFKYRSSDVRFWDFQNVVYQKPENFLQGIELKVNYKVNFRWISSLNNTSIETLIINNNSDSEVEFGYMRNLRNLTVSYGHLTTLPADSPMLLRNVTSLVLTYNCLSGVPEYVAQLEELEELTVSHNAECRGDLAPPFTVYADIFRSGNDRSWVMDTLQYLLEGEPHRYSLCLHERDFPVGSRIVDNVLQAIEDSNKVIIILSNSFILSKWCQWELEMVNHRMFDSSKSGYIILVQLEPIDENLLPPFLKVIMNTNTCLQWPRDAKMEVKHEILSALSLALGSSIHRTNSENASLIVNVRI